MEEEAGRVCTGYSKPYVGLYDEEHDTYSNVMKLGRGVSVNLDIKEADNNDFHADNVKAESAKGRFGGGSGTSVIDGLKRAAERMIYGLPAPDEEGWQDFDDDVSIPYVGHGYIKRYMSGGVESFVPVILRKIKFAMFGDSAETQEENINWQTQELSYELFRADNAKHSWRWIGKEYTTEAAAEAAMLAKFGVKP